MVAVVPMGAGAWNRIKTSAAEGVAAQQPPCRQPGAPDPAVYFNRRSRVLRTSGHKTAAARNAADSMQPGRNPCMIKPQSPAHQRRTLLSFIPPDSSISNHRSPRPCLSLSFKITPRSGQSSEKFPPPRCATHSNPLPQRSAGDAVRCRDLFDRAARRSVSLPLASAA